MHSCGLRTGETRALQTGQVDLDAGHIEVIWSKGHRSRRLPLTDQVIEILEHVRSDLASTFCLAADVFRLRYRQPGQRGNSREGIRPYLGPGRAAPARAGQQPRPYDFRHHFAYANIHRWMTAGDDVAAMLPYLFVVTWVMQPLTARTTTCTPRLTSWPPTPTSPGKATPCSRRWGSDETRPTHRRTGLLQVRPRLSARLHAQDQKAVTEND